MKSIIIVLLACFSLSSYAKQTKSEVSPSETPAEATAVATSLPPPPDVKRLEQVLNSESRQLDQIDSYINQGQCGSARALSQASLGRIKTQIGMDPTVQFRQIAIPVTGVLTNSDLTKDFGDLDNNQKDIIAGAVSNYQGGVFVSLLMHYKRIRIYQVKAMLCERLNGSKETKYQTEIDQALKVLANASSIPIMIKDANAKFKYQIFDDEILDPDYAFYGNLEVLDWSVTLRDLRLDESAFNELVSQKKLDARLAHNKGVRIKQSPRSDMYCTPCVSWGGVMFEYKILSWSNPYRYFYSGYFESREICEANQRIDIRCNSSQQLE